VHDQILGAVVVLSGQVAVQDGLDTIGISLLGVQGRSGHVRHHGVATSEGVLGVAQWVVLWCGLREPHIATIAAQVAGLEGLGDVLLDDDSTTSSVNEPGSCFVLD
jgi:hypothetical protein